MEAENARLSLSSEQQPIQNQINSRKPTYREKMLWILFIAVICFVFFGLGGYYLGLQSQPATVETGVNTLSVSLGEEFTLKKGDTARVKNSNVFLQLKDFIYSPCPKGAQCIWSGLAVVYELTVDGKVYGSSYDNSSSGTPYDVLVGKTDYKIYATFIVNKAS